MNSWRAWMVGLVTPVVLGTILVVGCTRDLSVPVSPGSIFTSTPSNTKTPTNTNTPTGPTNTFTETFTATNSATATQTPTVTNSPTQTLSPTDTTSPTPTLSPTDTLSPTSTSTLTVTPTVTQTNTPGNCVFQASYNFSNGADSQCWGTSGDWTPTVVVDTTDQYSGQDSLQAAATFTSETQVMNVIVNLTTPVNLTLGSTVSLYYEVQGAPNQNGQVIAVGATGGSAGTSSGGWQNTLSSTWTLATLTLTSDMTGVTQIGFQVLYGGTPNGPTAGPITINIADVNININTVPTPTPSSNGVTWTFEDDDVDYWAQVYPGSALGVTTITSFGGVVDTSTYGLAVPFPATTGNDIQSDCESGPIITSIGNWNTLGLASVSIQFHIDASMTGGGTAYPYVVAGGNHYGGTYGGWTGQCNGSCTYPGAGNWATVNFTPSGGTWSTDKTTVTAVGVDCNASNPTDTGNIVVDNITVY